MQCAYLLATHVTVFDGQILDPTFSCFGGACLACTGRFADHRGRRIEHGSLAFSLPTESNIMLHLRKLRVVVQKNVRCDSLSQEWGKCFNLNSLLYF